MTRREWLEKQFAAAHASHDARETKERRITEIQRELAALSAAPAPSSTEVGDE